MNRRASALLAAIVASRLCSIVGRAAPPACDPDNGGLTLPPGFCAAVVAENVGRARHLVVAPNGDVFVSTSAASPSVGDEPRVPSVLAPGPALAFCQPAGKHMEIVNP